MKEDKTVGVVIPIYNVQDYLRECLDSVINQTYKNLQVVLVNDGSTDENSLNIAKEYTLKDERFILFDKKNGGLSSSRNVGIEYFSKEYKLKNITNDIKENSLIEFSIEGNNPYEIYKVYKSSKFFKNENELLNFQTPNIDYIIFLDSDDYWELNCIEECVPRMDGVEVVWFDWHYHYDIKKIKLENITYHDRYQFKQNIITPLDWIKRYKKTGINWFSFAWNGMISFKHLLSYNLYFIDKIIHEDVAFGTNLFLSCNFITYLPQKLYNYRIRENSLCDYNNGNNHTWITPYMKNIYDQFQDIQQTKSYHRASSEVLTCIELLNFIENKIPNKYSKNILKNILNDRILCLWIILDYKKDPLKVLNKIPRQLLYQKIFYYKKTIENLNRTLKDKTNELKNKNNHFLILKDKEFFFTFHSLYGTAKQRIQNQLSYKLGQSMIINSKSIFGIIFMPIYLLSIFLTYKQEQKIYQEKIKKDPSLKLPPLESYPDYNEALKFKEHLSYKLGKALIKANNNWYRGGYIKLWFEIRRIKKEFKNKKA